jgi:hypothetical protein
MYHTGMIHPALYAITLAKTASVNVDKLRVS